MRVSLGVLGLFFITSAVLTTDITADDFGDTNLGEVGNRWVAESFSEYVKSAKGCVSAGHQERRVLVQGFGLFSGIKKNLSGAVVAKLAGLEEIPQTQHGGWATTRRLMVNGETVEFCFLYLDVVWDLASAILLTEIERFDPELVLMSGIGGGTAIAEGGVQNLATALHGYDGNGNPIREKNTPWCGEKPCGLSQSAYVLAPEEPLVESKVKLSWNNVAFAAQIRELTKSISPTPLVEAPDQARSSNDYLCNNVAYVVQSATNGVGVKLAGDRITFPAFPSTRKVGFFHYPYSGDPSDALVLAWASAVTKALQTTSVQNQETSRDLTI